MVTSVNHTHSVLKVSPTINLRFTKSGVGPPLLLLHTIRTQLEYFRALIPLLASKFTVYAIDLPGHGYSPIDPAASFDEPHMREAVTGAIRALELSELSIVGESIGATLALTVAAEMPERVRAVYALNTYDYETRYGDGIGRGSWFANFIIGSLQVPIFGAIGARLEDLRILRKVMAGGYADPSKLPEDLLRDFDRAAHSPGYRTASRKVLAGWRTWSDAKALYPAVKAPVTLIYGDQDWSYPADRERTEAALQHVRIFTLNDCGHFASVEQPHGVAEIVLSS